MKYVSCIFYLVGFCKTFAYDDLSYNKFATQSHTFTGTGYDASNAVDGNTATCMRSKDIGRSSLYKTVWWKVDLGEVYSIHSVNIIFRNYLEYEQRQRGWFAGFSLYVSNTDVSSSNVKQGSTLCYKDGPQLPLLNITTTCEMYGRYVIFYNERLDGVYYPGNYELGNVHSELCEVVVQGCKHPGVYGNDCNDSCPINCRDKKCYIHIGTCFDCRAGWMNMSCNMKCSEGWYGVNCSQQCERHCRDGATCNHVNGQCDRGCDAGWTGLMCDKECKDGTYGYNCVNNCSGHCLNNFPCNKQTDHCDGGCSTGYTNINCMEACPSGYFGFDCKKRCSGYCINTESCDYVSGVCLRGCQDGYTGALCSAYCIAGYYGRNCSFVCSSNCTKCRHTDGVCITNLLIIDTRNTEHVSPAWVIGLSLLLAVNIIVISALVIMEKFKQKRCQCYYSYLLLEVCIQRKSDCKL